MDVFRENFELYASSQQHLLRHIHTHLAMEYSLHDGAEYIAWFTWQRTLSGIQSQLCQQPRTVLLMQANLPPLWQTSFEPH